jgi:hypothetical protein
MFPGKVGECAELIAKQPNLTVISNSIFQFNGPNK